MFAENKPVKRHNETQLNNLDSQLVCIEAITNSQRILMYQTVRLMQLS